MEIFVCKFNMLKKCKIKTKKNKKGNKKKQGENQKTSKKAKPTKAYFAFFNSNPNDTASYARVYQTRAEVSRPSIIITKEVHYENVELQ